MASDFLPPDDPVIEPDDDLDAALSMLDVVDASDVVAQDAPPPIGRSWYYDFPSKRFLRNGGAPAAVQGDTTLDLWVEKTLRTARGAHPIYPSDYGMAEPNLLIGRVPTSADYSVLEGNIRDALTFHPRIVDITDFAVDRDPDEEAVLVNFTYVLDDGSARTVSNLPVG